MIPSRLDNKALCHKCGYMSENMPDVTALQRHTLNLFYSVLKF